MVYNDSTKQWITCGNHTVSHVYILRNAVTDSYRFVGFSDQNREACIFDIHWITSYLCKLCVGLHVSNNGSK